MWKIRRLLESISNIIYWFSIIWKDRQYDHEYVYTILLAKLKRIEKYYSTSKSVMQVEESKNQILKYVRLEISILKRIIEDDFYTDEDKKLLDKVTYKFVPCEDNSELSQLVCGNEVSKEVRMEIYNRGSKLKQKYKRLFFLILEKRVEHWWD
jgi:hypothetical protein